MNILKLLTPPLAAAALLLSSIASADIAIVVNPESGINEASTADIAQLFLGKRNHIGGEAVRAVDQGEDSDTREEFYTKVVNKTGSQLTAYWSRLIFTGKASPPQTVDNDAEVIEMVAEDEDFVGYVSPSSVDDTVKVIMVIP